MKVKELRTEYAAERDGIIPPLTNYAKWLENKLTSLYSGGVSEKDSHTILAEHCHIEYDKSGELTVHSTLASVQIAMDEYAKQFHHTPEISEEEIRQAASEYSRRDQSNEPEGSDNEDYIGFKKGVKWALSKGAKLKLTKCYNCKEMVEMISAGEFCPKCMC